MDRYKVVGKDYLAVCSMSGGYGFFGRSSDPDKAVEICKDVLVRDYPGKRSDIEGREVAFKLYDVSGHGDVAWDRDAAFPVSSPGDKIGGQNLKVSL